MNRRLRGWCFVAAACLPQPLWSETQGDFFGVWTGTVTEVVTAENRHASYEVTISLVPGDYRVDYPTLGCGGRLHFLERHGRWMRFRDELSYGLDVCSSGRTAFRLDGQERGVYMWFDGNGRLKAEGALTRRGQLMAGDVGEESVFGG